MRSSALRQIARNALIAAIYVTFTYLWGSVATGATLNIRLATALYVLPALDPALLWGPALGNAVSTLVTGGHPLDALLGVVVGLLAGGAAVWLGRKVSLWASPLAVLVVPTLIVPLWLSVLAHVPLLVVMGSLALGQALSAIAAWVLVLPAARRIMQRS